MSSLVLQYTDDAGSKSGNLGNYGWFTAQSGFIKPFKDVGLNNPVGTMLVMESDFGFHVMEVLAKAGYGNNLDGMQTTARPDGEKLFKANCAQCHTTTDQSTTGPGLKGVLSRIPGGNWQYDFIHNPAGMINSGDPYANSIYPAKYKTIMNAFPSLTNREIDAIMAWADHLGKPYGLEIDPARIAALQSEEFQNTLIATKEFEERLQVIFKLGSPEILDLYVNPDA